jgi:hypothetical protein
MRIIQFDLHCALVAETVGEGFYVRIDSVVSSNCSRDYIVSCYYTCFISPVGKQRHLAPPPYDHVVTAPVRAAAMHNTPYVSSFFWRAEGESVSASRFWRMQRKQVYENGKYAICEHCGTERGIHDCLGSHPQGLHRKSN